MVCREQETHFNLSLRETILSLHTESIQHVVRLLWNKVRRSVRVSTYPPLLHSLSSMNSSSITIMKPLLPETVIFPAIKPRYRFASRSRKHRSWRIKAAWRPTPCWDHWLACRGRVCARSRIGIPSPRISGTPGSRIPGRNVATTCPWDAALSVLAPTIGNVPTSLSGTLDRNCSQPRRTTRPSSPPFPGPPEARPASQRRLDGIDDCVARVRSIVFYKLIYITYRIYLYSYNFSLIKIYTV